VAVNRFAAAAVGALALSVAAVAQTGSNCLETILEGGNRGSNGGTVYYTLEIGANNLTFTDVYLNCAADAGAGVDIVVYRTDPGMGHVGNELNPAAWTQLSTGFGTTAGQNNFTEIALDTPFELQAGTTYGIAINLFHFGIGSGHEYTNGTGSNEVHENDDLTLRAGSATNSLFGPSVFTPRVWNGVLYYDGGTAGCEPPPPPPCEAVEIPSMTVASSQIDMDSLPVGPVTVADLNAAGTPGPAALSSVTLPDKPTAAAGIYDTNPGFGNALARLLGSVEIIAPSGAFDATTYDFTFSSPQTEFGVEVGDWNGPLIITLFSGGAQLAEITTTSVSATASRKFVALRGTECTTFDRATVDVSTTAGNFVVTEIWTGEGGGCYPDCDGSGALDFFDFLCFQNAFAAGEPYADCDGSGSLDFFDFLCFQNEFAAGCP
jgi:hypothetical protein